ncbi:MAG: thiamine-phosphate kinase, partial [Luteibaculum sp.]
MATHFNELGEFGWIHKLQETVKTSKPSTVKGIGDDAAVVEAATDKYSLLATDMLVEGVHFDVRYTPLKHLGYKAVVVNLSDIYAMNGQPENIMVSMAISSKYTVEAIEEIYQGIQLACDIYQVDLIGGDTCASPYGLTLSIAV